MVQSSAAPLVHVYFAVVVSLPARPLSRSIIPLSLSPPEQPFLSAHVLTESFADGSSALPSYGTIESASPCTCSTATGADGLHSDASFHTSPASATMPAMRAAESHAMRYDMNAPFECSTKKMRLGSMAKFCCMSS